LIVGEKIGGMKERREAIGGGSTFVTVIAEERLHCNHLQKGEVQ